MSWLLEQSSGGYGPVVTILSLILLYYLLLPSPIPGIPYNRQAALSPLGDIPALLTHYRRHGRVYDFISLQCVRHRSAVVQLFLLGRPLVVVSDMREIHDIVTRRVPEFDRDDIMIGMFSGFIGRSTITMKTHAAFWEQRKIWNCIMTDRFLSQIAAPSLYNSARELLEIWEHKSFLCKGEYAFPVAKDIELALVDAVWQISTGHAIGAIQAQLRTLRTLDRVKAPASKDHPIEFPTTKPPQIVEICRTFMHSTQSELMNPVPGLPKWLKQHSPHFRNALKHKAQMLNEAIQNGRDKFLGHKGSIEDLTCTTAIDFVLQRESRIIERKEGFAGLPNESFGDELLLVLLGGLETSVTTMAWGLKYLTDDLPFQQILRKSLKDYFVGYTGTMPPPAEEVRRASIPYLDATLHEILRMANTATFAIRQTSTNAKVLGHNIPQGTSVLLALEAEAYLFDQELPVDEQLRSSNSRESGSRWRVWSAARKREFDPMRWIYKDKEGKEAFDPQAGPSLPFSAGPRGCAGKKLAMLQLKLLVFVVVWHIELKSVPEQLSSYNARESFSRAPRQCFVRV